MQQRIQSYYNRKQDIKVHPKYLSVLWTGDKWINLPKAICNGDENIMDLVLLILLPSAKPHDIPYLPTAEEPNVTNFIHFHAIVDEIEQGEQGESLNAIINRQLEKMEDAQLFLDRIDSQHETYYGYEIGPEKFNPRMSHWLEAIKEGQLNLHSDAYNAIFKGISNTIENSMQTYFYRSVNICKLLTKREVTYGFIHAAKMLRSHCLAMRSKNREEEPDIDTKDYFFDLSNLPEIGADLNVYASEYQKKERLPVKRRQLEPMDPNSIEYKTHQHYLRADRMMGSLNDNVSSRPMVLTPQAKANRERKLKERDEAAAIIQGFNERQNMKWSPPGFAYNETDRYIVYYIGEDEGIQSGIASLNDVNLPKGAHIDKLNIGGYDVRFPRPSEEADEGEVWSTVNDCWKFSVRF